MLSLFYNSENQGTEEELAQGPPALNWGRWVMDPGILAPEPVGFPCGSAGKESACNVGDLGWEDPLEKGKVTHSSILAWRRPWTV